ncbi:MAG: N-acetyltransferase [bacterium]
MDFSQIAPVCKATGTLRKARMGDAPQLFKLINLHSSKGELLPRTMNELFENLRDFYVFEQDEKVVACTALHVMWEDLAEIKSLVVAESHQGQGLGQLLVDRVLREANELGIRRVFALTFKPKFFEKIGFSVIDKGELPQKVWGECVKCHLFPECQEIAVIKNLN